MMSEDSNSSDIFVPIKNATEYQKCIRLQELQECFQQEYGIEPEFCVKVPGRVNIIGEHIDYCGYAVLPMTIENNIILAVAASNDGLLHLRNINKKYENFKCDLNSLRIDNNPSEAPKWYNYFLCGVKGILENGGDRLVSGMYVAVSGNIPPASGLSSSSALVSSATLATAFLNKIPLNKQTLAAISACCEQYIGTQGGGMDQAIAFLGQKGCAQFIQFLPKLQAQSVQLPNDVHFVVANSLAEANKAATSDFNERVVECRTACRILAKQLKLNNWIDITKFAVLQSILDCDLEELEKLVLQTFPKDEYSRNDILEELNIGEEELENVLLTPNTKSMYKFKLRQRAVHVVQESMRVWKFRRICESNDHNLDALSELMKQSHQSLRFLYECSHPYLDELVDISAKMGIGARLTGAGWGGCIVAICKSKTQCRMFIDEVKEKYYKHLPQFKGKSLNDIIFSTCPQNGAEIIVIENKKS